MPTGSHRKHAWAPEQAPARVGTRASTPAHCCTCQVPGRHVLHWPLSHTPVDAPSEFLRPKRSVAVPASPRARARMRQAQNSAPPLHHRGWQGAPQWPAGAHRPGAQTQHATASAWPGRGHWGPGGWAGGGGGQGVRPWGSPQKVGSTAVARCTMQQAWAAARASTGQQTTVPAQLQV